jgi:uncharacterized protein YndB with AHSA1/START domain
MANQATIEAEAQSLSRIFDAPRALVWKAWTTPEYVMEWWGPKGFTSPVCRIDLCVGGRVTYSMRTPDGSSAGACPIRLDPASLQNPRSPCSTDLSDPTIEFTGISCAHPSQ